MVRDFAQIATFIPVERAGTAAECGKVAVSASGWQEFLATPVFGRTTIPDLVKGLMPQAAHTLLKARTRQHAAIRGNAQ
jgi:hypothetical protein